jgi:hypothetical protein
VESNVQREITAIKTLAESIKSSTAASSSSMEARMAQLEKGIDTVILRLSDVQVSHRPTSSNTK